MQGGALSGGVCPSTGRRIGGVPSRGKRSARIVPPSTRPADSGSPLRHAGLKPKRGTIVLPHRFSMDRHARGDLQDAGVLAFHLGLLFAGKCFAGIMARSYAPFLAKAADGPGVYLHTEVEYQTLPAGVNGGHYSARPRPIERAPQADLPPGVVAAVVAVKAPLKKDFRQAWLFHCRLSSLPPKKQKTGQALSPALFRFGLGEYYYYPLARAFSRSVSFTMKFHESRHISSIVRVASQPSSFFAFDTSA